MPKYIHNKSDTERTYAGSIAAPSSFLLITPEKDSSFAQDNDLCLDLATTSVCMSSDGVSDYTGNYSEQLDFLKGFDQKFSVDTEQAQLVRIKAAPAGWTFQARGIELTTSKLDSFYNKNHAGDDYEDLSVKFYESVSGEFVLIASSASQGYLDSNCVKTVVELEPAYDYEVIGGFSKIGASPTSDVRLSVIAVPDVPANLGGHKVMIENANFRFIGSGDKVQSDGRASKRLNYDATYHTNKLQFNISHPVGEKHEIMFVLEHFKA